MKKLAQITSVSYCVELTLNQYLALEARDDREQNAERSCDLDSILSGVTHARSIDFNGHFGAAVYFTLCVDELDDAEIVAKIIKMYATRKSLVDIFEESVKSKYSHRKNTNFISSFESTIGRYKDADGQVKLL